MTTLTGPLRIDAVALPGTALLVPVVAAEDWGILRTYWRGAMVDGASCILCALPTKDSISDSPIYAVIANGVRVPGTWASLPEAVAALAAALGDTHE